MGEEEKSYLTTEIICTDCGKKFIFRKHEFESFTKRGWNLPKRCHSCQKIINDKREARQNAIKSAEWEKKREENQREFEHRLISWNVKNYTDISPKEEGTLYILGNGFDMMHGVNSSYGSFRDSLGKTCSLRINLESFLTVEDIWADFEEALAHLNVQFFSSRMNANNWLDIMGAYEKDAGAAEFFMAAEYATQVVQDIVADLPRRFYNWVKKLKVGTDDRPLQQMFCTGKVLNFNYTEFAETLYGVPEERICYIHGCRRKKKGFPQEKLILGHAPGASDPAFTEKDHTHVDMRNQWRREMIYAVQDIIGRQLAEYDDELTKNCSEIIEDHMEFFHSLELISTVITVGHSLSKVDWPYFAEIISKLSNKNTVQWYFGCHGLRDLENLDGMLKEIRIDRKMVTVFRTDIIDVRKNIPLNTMQKASNSPKAKTLGGSADGKWRIQTVGKTLQIVNCNSGLINYEVEFSNKLHSMCFVSGGKKLIVVSRDYPSGIFLFGLNDDKWKLIGELESSTDYNFLTKSLNRILLSEDKITFVYNNRIREHSLADGSLIYTRQYQGARNGKFDGEDVTKILCGYKSR